MDKKMNYSTNVTWKEISPGGVVTEAGNSEKFKTGDWRSERPIWHEENCVHCLLCWVVCPDNAIKAEDGKMKGFDYDHCKGCLVCVQQCKFKALSHAVEE